MPVAREDMTFNNPHLNILDFKLNKEFDEEFYDGDGNIQINVEYQVREDPETGEEVSDECKTLVTVIIGEDEKTFPFYIHVEMEAVFQWNLEIDINIDEFVRFQTPAIVYSYMRPIVSDTVSKSGYPPFNLPFMDFTRNEEIESDN